MTTAPVKCPRQAVFSHSDYNLASKHSVPTPQHPQAPVNREEATGDKLETDGKMAVLLLE